VFLFFERVILVGLAINCVNFVCFCVIFIFLSKNKGVLLVDIRNIQNIDTVIINIS